MLFPFGGNVKFGEGYGFNYGASYALIGILKNQGIQSIIAIGIFVLLLAHVVHHW